MSQTLDLSVEQIDIKNVSATHKIFTYNDNIIILDFDKKTNKWNSRIFQQVIPESTADKDGMYKLLTWAIRTVDNDGVFCPNYITEITNTDFEITYHELIY